MQWLCILVKCVTIIHVMWGNYKYEWVKCFLVCLFYKIKIFFIDIGKISICHLSQINDVFCILKREKL